MEELKNLLNKTKLLAVKYQKLKEEVKVLTENKNRIKSELKELYSKIDKLEKT